MYKTHDILPHKPRGHTEYPSTHMHTANSDTCTPSSSSSRRKFPVPCSIHMHAHERTLTHRRTCGRRTRASLHVFVHFCVCARRRRAPFSYTAHSENTSLVLCEFDTRSVSVGTRPVRVFICVCVCVWAMHFRVIAIITGRSDYAHVCPQHFGESHVSNVEFNVFVM